MSESVSPNSDSPLRPIVFLGPSVPMDVAQRTLPQACYRPPIKRGDLDDVPAGALVGIIDGVFAQNLAISPGEIRDALARGVTIYGAASMGALRAAEIPGIHGVGRIYEMYCTGAIERDDEVALLFDPHTNKPLTQPLVNIRYAVERLVRSASLSRKAGDAIIEACSQLHYGERTFGNIFKHSKLAQKMDADYTIQLLQNFDLKRDDALFLLETLALVKTPASLPAIAGAKAIDDSTETWQRVQDHEHSDAPILIWESGDLVDFSRLVLFLKVTAAFEPFARRALGRLALAGTPLRPLSNSSTQDPANTENEAQALLDSTRLEWGWESPEEAHVTMRDLGLGFLDVAASLQAEVKADQLLRTFARTETKAFKKALRIELWLNELSLKREVMRCSAVDFFETRGSNDGPLTEAQISDARRCICRLHGAMQWSLIQADLEAFGVSRDELDSMVQSFALARRNAWPIVEALDHRFKQQSPTSRAAKWRALGLQFESSIKPQGSRRFSLPLSDAVRCADQIAKQMGIVRIGLIGELDTLGVHVAQAFGDRSGWSSTFSSGKAETREGARVGSIMEETEIHAQDAFQPRTEVRTPFADYDGPIPLVDPKELDLPYDSRYSDSLELEWAECSDLLGCRKMLIPSAALLGERIANDIYYSPRLGGKIFSSSGLGSGFSLAEATVHAAAELIERHAQRLAELEIDNPGGVGVRQFWFVDHDSLPETPRRIVSKYKKGGMCVRILDITSEVAVPTFYARVFDDPFIHERSTSSDGFACHPDPEVAITMALLEAAQTKAGVIAGGREDYSLQARSLGRHERPRTMVPPAQVFWFCNDRPTRSFDEIKGFITSDILEELEWIIDRLAEAGFDQVLVVDYTMSRVRPAHVVRVAIPGLEATNPLFTGARARAVCIRDLLPRRAAEAD
jgi:ribosomal protein S12 methylthiotransferase accessory factor